ncbi:hypothetical protein ACOMHN_006163 [Nucella lapillus]
MQQVLDFDQHLLHWRLFGYKVLCWKSAFSDKNFYSRVYSEHPEYLTEQWSEVVQHALYLVLNFLTMVKEYSLSQKNMRWLAVVQHASYLILNSLTMKE